MKFKADIKKLLSVCKTTTGATKTNTLLPMSSNLLLEVLSEEELQITASDGQNVIISQATIENGEVGSICVSSIDFTDILYRNEVGNITIHVLENNKIQFRTKHSRAHISGIPAHEFLDIPDVSEITYDFSMPQAVLSRIMELVLLSTSRSDRAVFGACLWIINDGCIEFISTNGVIMCHVIYSSPSIKPLFPVRSVIDTRTLELIQKNMCLSSNDQIRVRVLNNKLHLQTEYHTLCALQIEDQYPNYEQLISLEYEHDITIDRFDLVRSLKAGEKFSGDKSLTIWKFEDELLTISSQIEQRGDSMTSMVIPYTDTPFNIGVNSKHALSIMTTLLKPDIRLTFHNPLQPLYIFSQEDDIHIHYVLMPMRL